MKQFYGLGIKKKKSHRQEKILVVLLIIVLLGVLVMIWNDKAMAFQKTALTYIHKDTLFHPYQYTPQRPSKFRYRKVMTFDGEISPAWAMTWKVINVKKAYYFQFKEIEGVPMVQMYPVVETTMKNPILNAKIKTVVLIWNRKMAMIAFRYIKKEVKYLFEYDSGQDKFVQILP